MVEEHAKKKLILWLGLVILVCILLRVVLFMYYPPVSYSDTGGYFRSAKAVLGGFVNYDGTRTPIYPVFIALMGSEQAVYVGQLLLGFGMTMIWFVIGWKATGKPFFGGLAALAHTLNPGQIFFEANLLTETLATFWLTLSFLGVFLWLTNPKCRSIWMGLGIGLSTTFAVLTRPQFIFMPFWLAALLTFTYQDKHFILDWKPVLGVLLPVILIVGGWMGWIQSRYHVFSVTTMTGFHLVQHTGYYFEDVPDEFAALRQVFLEYRDARVDSYATQSNTIWEAIPAMQKATGMGFYELSRTLQRISIRLILTHPWQYFRRVAKGWWMFWRAPVYWRKDVFTNPVGLALMTGWVLTARGLMLIVNLIFIVTSLSALASSRLRNLFRLNRFDWLLAGAVWGTSLFTSLLEHGENQRFLIPLQTVVSFWVIWIIESAWRLKQTSHRKVA